MRVEIEVKSSGRGPSFRHTRFVETTGAVRIMEYLTVGVLLAAGHRDGVAVIIRRAG